MWLVYSNPWQLFLLFYAGRPLPPPIDGAKVNAKCRSIIHAGSHVGLACRLQEHRFPKAAVAFGELDRILNMSIKTLMPVSRTIGKKSQYSQETYIYYCFLFCRMGVMVYVWGQNSYLFSVSFNVSPIVFDEELLAAHHINLACKF